MPRMHYDTTPAAVTAWCECGWREIALTTEGARRTAVDHERSVHPDDRHVRDAALLREARAARDTISRDARQSRDR